MDFSNGCPYNISKSSLETINGAYDSIAEYFVKTGELKQEASDLNNLETLFDIQKSTYKHLTDCSSELRLLKQMWDLISLIDCQFEAWKTTLWDKIDTENLMSLIKDMQTKQTNP